MFTNQASSLPVAEIELTDGPVCADHSIHGMSESRTPYELENTNEWNQCSLEIANTKVDPRFSSLDSVLESRLYRENGVTPVLRALPYFKEQRTDITWTLYLAHFFEWKSACESTYSRK